MGFSKLTLFRAIAAAVAEDPESPRVRRLARQWHATVEPETRAALKHRARWPAGMRAYVASLYDTTAEAWDRVARVLDASRDAAPASVPERL